MGETSPFLCQWHGHRATFGYQCPHGTWCTYHLREHLGSEAKCRQLFLIDMKSVAEKLARALAIVRDFDVYMGNE